MKRKDFKELRTKKTDQLSAVLKEKQAKLDDLVSGKRVLRKEIAQILTIMKENQILKKEGLKDK